MKYNWIHRIIVGWIVITGLVILFTCSNPARAHETEIWHDANKYIMSGTGGQKDCGMGYRLSHQANGEWQPYLFAGHWHIAHWTLPTPSCDAFYDRLNKEAFDE